MKLIITFLLSCFVLNSNSQIITTFAGTGSVGYSGNGGPATSALLFDPQTLCTDNAGNVYIPDHGNHVVRVVNTLGIISIFAGTGISGNSGDGGPASAAQLMFPYGLCKDNAGNIYISDQGVNVIRKVTPAGIISTIAGTGSFGFSGDGGPALLAHFSGAGGMAIDNSGNLYVADFGNQRIRKINSSGIITTVAGSSSVFLGDGGPATQASLSSPTGVCVDNLGNFYIADMGNSRIRKVDASGIITTFAGQSIGYSGNGGPAINASLKYPFFVYSDNSGNIFISDTGNGALRVVNSAGIINTVAGTGVPGYSGDGGPAILAQLSSLGGIAMDNGGNIYIPGAAVVRKIGSCLLSSISQQPVDAVVCAGGTTNFSVIGNLISSYQWQVNTGAGWNPIINGANYSGATTNVLTITSSLIGMNNYQYRCLLTNNCSSTFSSISTLQVLTAAPPAITIAASSTTICAGTPVTFISSVTGGGSSPVYQWKKNGLPSGNGITYTDNALNNGDQISCNIISSNSCALINSTVSNMISMTVTSSIIPSVSITSDVNNVCQGTTINFTAVAVNAGIGSIFQWKKNSVIVGSSLNMYQDNNLNNNDLISCSISASLSCASPSVVNSNVIHVLVQPLITPTISISTNTNTVCRNSVVAFTVAVQYGGTSPVYQWAKNALPVGNNSNVYTYNNPLSGDVISCMMTSNNSCIAFPSVISNPIAISVVNNPVTLDKTSVICEGSTRVLEAGNYQSYVWNDGSVNHALNASGTGNFYVTVKDTYGCIWSDTSKITTLLAKPVNFLPADTSICSYGAIEIKTLRNFNSYLWSNSSQNNSINVTTSGSYWLKVTDNNGCMGYDTIKILPKQCTTNVFFPSAFSPNGDSKNDIFKALVIGKIKSFKLQIFDKGGQLMFETQNFLEGWNGLYKGREFNTATFVWQCFYQFEGLPPEYQKGSLILIR